MTSVFVPTSYLPLTTTFTAPASCFNNPWQILEGATTWWKQGGDGDANCFPPAFPFSNSRIVYSPGICPAGWTSACDETISTTGTLQTIVSCCPRSFECATTTRSLHDWEDAYGCASPYSIDPAVWAVPSDAPFVSSMYQLQVMIVTSTQTSSSIETSSSPRPASTASSTSMPTGGSNPTPPNDQGGSELSKGAIAGIVVGSVVGVAVVGILAYIAWMVKRKHRASAEAPSMMAQNPGPMSNMCYDANYAYPVTSAEMHGAGQPTPVYELKAPT